LAKQQEQPRQEQTGLIELKSYEDRGYNVLAPTTHMQQISPFHRIRIETVQVDPDPEKGDVYKVGSKYVGEDKQGNLKYEDELTFSKVALMKFADAAGITWNWRDTRAVTVTPDYVYYEAVAAIRKTSGEWRVLKGSAEIDLKVKEQEIFEQKLATAKKYEADKNKKSWLGGKTPEQWAREKTAEDMLRERKFKLRKAETAAMERVIRMALCLKQKYSPAELKKPFAIPKIDFAPDYSDPEVKRALLQQGMQATNNLFGATATQGDGGAIFDGGKESPAPAEIVEAEVVDSVTEGQEPDGPSTDLPEDDGEPPVNLPWEQEILCQNCNEPITAMGDWAQEDILKFSRENFKDAEYCGRCMRKKIDEIKQRRGQQ
jgi:hypothetical protein